MPQVEQGRFVVSAPERITCPECGDEDIATDPEGRCECADGHRFWDTNAPEWVELRRVQALAAKLPQRIALCPEHAPEFYYPLADGESLTCPQCSLEMVVYERA